MNVSFTNLFKASQYGDKKFKKKIINGLSRLIYKNQFIGGEQVNKFEKKFSKYININNCITVANGTDALEIAVESFDSSKYKEAVYLPNYMVIQLLEDNHFHLHHITCDRQYYHYCLW